MPAAGHMVHMPSHIYQRVGRYADAMESNQLAVAADESYIAQCRAQGLYPMAYYPHNMHFLWFAAAARRPEQARHRRRPARSPAHHRGQAWRACRSPPASASCRTGPTCAFGRWEEMLEEPRPPASNVFLTGAWHYARGTALAATGHLAAADASSRRSRR